MSDFYPTDFEGSSHQGDPMPYGFKKNTQKYLKYLEDIRKKRPQIAEHHSTMLAPTAQKAKNPFESVRGVMAQSEERLRKEKAIKISRSKRSQPKPRRSK